MVAAKRKLLGMARVRRSRRWLKLLPADFGPPAAPSRGDGFESPFAFTGTIVSTMIACRLMRSKASCERNPRIAFARPPTSRNIGFDGRCAWPTRRRNVNLPNPDSDSRPRSERTAPRWSGMSSTAYVAADQSGTAIHCRHDVFVRRQEQDLQARRQTPAQGSRASIMSSCAVRTTKPWRTSPSTRSRPAK